MSHDQGNQDDQEGRVTVIDRIWRAGRQRHPAPRLVIDTQITSDWDGADANLTLMLGVQEMRRIRAIRSLPGLTPDQQQDAVSVGMSPEEAAQAHADGWPTPTTITTLKALRGTPDSDVEIQQVCDLLNLDRSGSGPADAATDPAR